MKDIHAITFYKSLDNKDKYKLVNGLFIIKYIDKNLSEHVGDFWKEDKTIRLNQNEYKQLFKKIGKKVLSHTRMDIAKKYPSINFWRELTISFIETPIEDILK